MICNSSGWRLGLYLPSDLFVSVPCRLQCHNRTDRIKMMIYFLYNVYVLKNSKIHMRSAGGCRKFFLRHETHCLQYIRHAVTFYKTRYEERVQFQNVLFILRHQSIRISFLKWSRQYLFIYMYNNSKLAVVCYFLYLNTRKYKSFKNITVMAYFLRIILSDLDPPFDGMLFV